jgi:hypothetical protein
VIVGDPVPQPVPMATVVIIGIGQIGSFIQPAAGHVLQLKAAGARRKRRRFSATGANQRIRNIHKSRGTIGDNERMAACACIAYVTVDDTETAALVPINNVWC